MRLDTGEELMAFRSAAERPAIKVEARVWVTWRTEDVRVVAARAAQCIDIARAFAGALLACGLFAAGAAAQVLPSPPEIAAYTGRHAAAARGDAAEIARLVAGGADPNGRDPYRRTPLHVAAHRSQLDAMRALVKAGTNPNALEADRFDIVTL